MSDKQAQEATEEVLNDDVADSGDEVAAEEVTAEVEEEVDELTALRQELGELKERMMRQQAEFDNTRRRLRREMEEAGNRALVRFVRPVLVELDNFGLALNAANPEKFQDFAMGVSMIKTNIENTLSGSGITMIPAEGIFDPAKHEVVQEIEHEELPKGTIIEVFRAGYQLGDQVIRASQVMVSKGQPAPAEPDPAEESVEESEEE